MMEYTLYSYDGEGLRHISERNFSLKNAHYIHFGQCFKMGCPALGIWVAFLKQPDALPGRAPQQKNYIYF
jgi:hypothetical protein